MATTVRPISASETLNSRAIPTAASTRCAAEAGQLIRFEAGHLKALRLQPGLDFGVGHRQVDGIAQTRDWLQWLQATLLESAGRGLDLSEVIRLPMPERFASWAAQPAEFIRSVHQLYPAYERQALRGATVTAQ